MPQINGFSVYVAAPHGQHRGWTVRVYRDSDDAHLHSAEDCGTLQVALREVERALIEDTNALPDDDGRPVVGDLGPLGGGV